MEILVAGQPVFDRREQLYAYDFEVRHPGRVDGVPDEVLGQRVGHTVFGIGINQIAAGCQAFVTIDRNMLLNDAAQLLPADRIVLHLAENPGNDPEVVDACGLLAFAGYQFSLSCDRPGEMPEELLRIASIAKVDVAAIDRAALSDLTAWLRGFDLRLLATNVRHRMERDICVNLGFDLFQWYGLAAPEMFTPDLPIEHVSTFRLLRTVRDPRSTDGEIEDMLRRDVALSYKLLRMVSSPSVGGRDIWSIGHALRLLGRDQVARWLSLLLVTNGARDGVRVELMDLSLVRARMCELLADASGVPRARGPLFLVGMLSMLDQLLEMPMELLADSIELARDIRMALLKREDYYGSILSLVEAYELGQWDKVDALAGAVGLGSVALPPLYLQATAWANEHGRASEEAPAPRGAGSAPTAPLRKLIESR